MQIFYKYLSVSTASFIILVASLVGVKIGQHDPSPASDEMLSFVSTAYADVAASDTLDTAGCGSGSGCSGGCCGGSCAGGE